MDASFASHPPGGISGSSGLGVVEPDVDGSDVAGPGWEGAEVTISAPVIKWTSPQRSWLVKFTRACDEDLS